MIIDMDIRIPNTTEKKYFCCLIVMKRLSLEKRSYSITSLTVVANIPVGQNPFAVAVNPSNNLAYVVNRGVGILSLTDGKTNNVVSANNTDQNQSAIAVNPSTGLVYVANFGSNSVSVKDGSKANVEKVDIVVSAPSAIAADISTNMVYVANHYSNTVSVIDGKTNSVTGNVIVGVR
jgi:YVTN family beta-propeller protein